MERGVLSFFGLYPEKSSKLSFWKNVRKTLCLLSYHIHLIELVINSFNQSFEETPFSVVWVSEIGFLLKLLTFLQHTETLLHFEDMLDQEIFKNVPNSCFDSISKTIEFIKIFTTSKILLLLLFVSYISCYVPLVVQSGKRHLPCDPYVPCSLENDFCYVGFFIFHLANCILAALLDTIFDCLYCKLTTICCCLLDVTYTSLEEMDYGDSNDSLKLIHHKAILHVKVLK